MLRCPPPPSLCSESESLLHHPQLRVGCLQVLFGAGSQCMTSNIKILWNMRDQDVLFQRDLVVAVDQLRTRRPEDGQVGQHEPVVQVHVLLAPVHDGRVEPVDLLDARSVGGHDAVAKVPPVAVRLPLDHGEDNGEVDLLPKPGETADVVENVRGELDINIH